MTGLERYITPEAEVTVLLPESQVLNTSDGSAILDQPGPGWII